MDIYNISPQIARFHQGIILLTVIFGYSFNIHNIYHELDPHTHPDIWFYLLGHFATCLLYWSTYGDGLIRKIDMLMSLIIMCGMTYVGLTRLQCPDHQLRQITGVILMFSGLACYYIGTHVDQNHCSITWHVIFHLLCQYATYLIITCI